LIGVNTEAPLIFCCIVEMLIRQKVGRMNASSGTNKGTGIENQFSSPQRITITIPAMTLKKLLKRSLVEGRSLSNLAAYILEQALASDSQD
jgi:hypothetical protein